MSKVRKILISAGISLGILLIAIYVVNLGRNKNMVEIPIALTSIKEGTILEKVKFLQININIYL